MAKKILEPEKLIQRLIAIIERQITLLEEAESLTEEDVKAIGEYFRLLLSFGKDQKATDSKMSKEVGRLSDEELKSILKDSQ